MSTCVERINRSGDRPRLPSLPSLRSLHSHHNKAARCPVRTKKNIANQTKPAVCLFVCLFVCFLHAAAHATYVPEQERGPTPARVAGMVTGSKQPPILPRRHGQRKPNTIISLPTAGMLLLLLVILLCCAVGGRFYTVREKLTSNSRAVLVDKNKRAAEACPTTATFYPRVPQNTQYSIIPRR